MARRNRERKARRALYARLVRHNGPSMRAVLEELIRRIETDPVFAAGSMARIQAGFEKKAADQRERGRKARGLSI